MATLLEYIHSTGETQNVKEVYELYDEMVVNRRWFHKHPELSFEEVKSAAYITEKLESYGITEIYQQVGVTGVVAMIRGAHSGPTVGLRADMDALPVQETRSDIDYASVNEGVMHACGHDGHMSELLCAAKVIFNKLRPIMKGNRAGGGRRP